jgi:hypothetical protein
MNIFIHNIFITYLILFFLGEIFTFSENNITSRVIQNKLHMGILYYLLLLFRQNVIKLSSFTLGTLGFFPMILQVFFHWFAHDLDFVLIFLHWLDGIQIFSGPVYTVFFFLNYYFAEEVSLEIVLV